MAFADILLNEEIESELKELKKLQVGTEEYKIAVDGISMLMDRSLATIKLRNDMDEADITRESDNELKHEQLKNDRRGKRIQHIAEVTCTVLQVSVTIWGVLKSLKFEETGTITTNVGRGFMNRILSKK